MFTLTGVITGATMTGLTSPTYTLTADTPPSNFAKQSYVSALGGTQTGVTAHSLDYPFTVAVKRQSRLRTVADAMYNSVAGRYSKVPFNTWDIVFRKGCQMANGQVLNNQINVTQKIYAGTETPGIAPLRALYSFAGGFLSSNASGAVDSVTTGAL